MKTQNFCMVLIIYLMHIKDEKSDFYAMFRVEDFKQGEYCTIT